MIASQITCPVCNNGDPKGDKAHDSGPRIVGFAALACPSLTPVGEVRFFPKWEPAVIVIGAGLWVDSVPEKPKAISDLQSEIAELERRKAISAEQTETREALEQKLAALKAEAAK